MGRHISITAYYFKIQAMKSDFQTRIGPYEFDTCCCSCIRGSYIYHVKREWRKRRGKEGRKGLLNEIGGRRRRRTMLTSHLSISRSLSRFSQIRGTNARAGRRKEETATKPFFRF